MQVRKARRKAKQEHELLQLWEAWSLFHLHNAFFSSFLMLTETVLFWTVDSVATNHITRD